MIVLNGSLKSTTSVQTSPRGNLKVKTNLVIDIRAGDLSEFSCGKSRIFFINCYREIRNF